LKKIRRQYQSSYLEDLNLEFISDNMRRVHGRTAKMEEKSLKEGYGGDENLDEGVE
jgi:hypothetical protein